MIAVTKKLKVKIKFEITRTWSCLVTWAYSRITGTFRLAWNTLWRRSTISSEAVPENTGVKTTNRSNILDYELFLLSLWLIFWIALPLKWHYWCYTLTHFPSCVSFAKIISIKGTSGQVKRQLPLSASRSLSSVCGFILIKGAAISMARSRSMSDCSRAWVALVGANCKNLASHD